jgi:cytochrome P450
MQLFGYLVGGSDTTATTFAWFCKYISDHQSAQSTLRAALRSAHSTAASERRAPNVKEIISASVPYLDATMEEVLRCAGTVPFVPRDAVVDTTLLGHHVPKGTLILFINQGPGIVTPPISQKVPEEVRSASSRAHADVRGEWDATDIGAFKPERWLVPVPAEEGSKSGGKESFNPAAGPHMAFGAGPRGCFGRRLAYLELRILFTMLIWTFEFQQPPEALRNYEALDSMTTLPKMAYVKLRRVEW